MLLKKYLHKGISVAPPPTDGTYGYFKTGASGTVSTTRYTFANGAIATGPNLTQSTPRVAAGNTVMGIFLVSGSTVASGKLIFSSLVASNTASLGLITGSGGVGFGNATVGLFGATSASAGALTAKYTYSGDVIAAGSSLTANINSGTSAGDTNRSLVVFGETGGTTTTENYYYADDSVAPATALVTPFFGGASCSNSSQGIIACGGSAATKTTNSYTWASEVTAAATSLQTATNGNLKSAGNGTLGVFVVSTLGDTNVYNYSAGTTAIGTTVGSINAAAPAALSNGISGVNT